tara:strand:+ start:52 stop:234 length:183 start_codon:yes stop_codon:yes gene_type:complete
MIITTEESKSLIEIQSLKIKDIAKKIFEYNDLGFKTKTINELKLNIERLEQLIYNHKTLN